MAVRRAANLTPGVALGLALAALLSWRFDFLVDDAFITFRYARHLAEGHGLVWNLGESPPVEGFSNFLWVVLCAAFEALGISPLAASRATSAACALALTWLVARVVRSHCADDSHAADWTALAFAALPPIGVWATGGLETMPFALSVFGCFEALTRRAADGAPGTRRAVLASGAWAAAAVLLRADGLVWIGCALAAALAHHRARRPSNDGARWTSVLAPLAWTTLIACAVAVAYVLWRHSYFGEWAPNTARVKVHLGPQALERGAKYVGSLALSVLSVPLALGGALYVLRRDSTALASPALVFFALGAAYVSLVGGDWMMMHRMLVPALPFAALGFAAWLAALNSARTRAAAGVTAIVLGLLPGFDVHLAPRALRESCHFRWGQEYRTEHAVWRKGVVDIAGWIAIGRALAIHTRPGEAMVLGNIGAFGYFPENLVVYDTHGLTNKAPLQPANPDGRGMPGHDFKVDMGAFAALKPTYLNARIVPERDPFAVIPEGWRELDEAGRVRPNAGALERFEFLLRPLPASEGFEPGAALLLIRNRR